MTRSIVPFVAAFLVCIDCEGSLAQEQTGSAPPDPASTLATVQPGAKLNEGAPESTGEGHVRAGAVPTGTDVLPAKLRVGTYDSRAIAMAHFGKRIRDGLLRNLYSAHKEATDSGNNKTAAELARKGQFLQEQLHRQMFAASRPEEALAKLKPSLPNLAEALNVSMIVSVHDIAFRSDSIELVDVTMEMVELFDPSQETLEKIEAVLEHPPVADSVLERMESGYPSPLK